MLGIIYVYTICACILKSNGQSMALHQLYIVVVCYFPNLIILA